MTICVEIISPDNIGEAELYLEVEAIENTGQASKSHSTSIKHSLCNKMAIADVLMTHSLSRNCVLSKITCSKN